MLTAIVIGLLIVLLGAAFCIYGYRLFIYLLPVWGFVTGFLLGAQGVSNLLGQGFLATITGWIAGAALGLLLAILSYFIYTFAVYMLATTFGLILGIALMHILGLDSGLIVTIAALAGAVGMILLVAFLDIKKWLIVAITSFGGSFAIIAGILTIFGIISFSELQAGSNPISDAVQHSFIWVLLWLAVGVAGIVLQARNTKDFAVDDHIDAYRERLSGFRGTDSSYSQGEDSTATINGMEDPAAAEPVQSGELASQEPESG